MKNKTGLLFLLFLSSCPLISMQQQIARRQVTPKEIIVCGLVGGLTIEAVYLVMQEERYKHVGRFMVDHPGLSIAATSALLGTGMIYRDTVRNVILGLADLVR